MMTYASAEGMVFVQTIYNGVPFRFEECDNDFVCTVDEFLQVMSDRLTEDENLKDLCDAQIPADPLSQRLDHFNQKFLQFTQ